MKISLIIPVRNEIEGVKVIMPQIKKGWVDEIIIIDGNSTDGTREWLIEQSYKVIPQKIIGGMYGWWEGFMAATGDVWIIFSPDGNSVPEAIPQLIDKMKEGYDMVIASRYYGEAKSEDDDVGSAIGNLLFTKLINLLFRSRYTDSLVMYRALRSDFLKKIDFNEQTGLRFNQKRKVPLFEIICSIRAAKKHLKVAEIPADEPKRIGSEKSEAHPGSLGKYISAFVFLAHIIYEFIIWPFQKK